jgi:hypothetical protein
MQQAKHARALRAAPLANHHLVLFNTSYYRTLSHIGSQLRR